MFGKDQEKSTQVKRGGTHNCRIDETIVLDVTGDIWSVSACKALHGTKGVIYLCGCSLRQQLAESKRACADRACE